jgi:hypothetical protein
MSTKRTTYDPWNHAHDLGVNVEWGETHGNLGLWDGHTIRLAPDLNRREERCVLAHEIVHAEFEDEPTSDHFWHARREARCDRLAATRLICPNRLLELAATTEDMGIWALELGVTGWLLEAYLKANPHGLHR